MIRNTMKSSSNWISSVWLNSVLWVVLFLVCNFGEGVKVTYDGRSLMLDGERKIIMSGSIHYPRSTPQMWPGLIQKAKDGGLNTIETYVFWDVHEPHRREYHFEGRLDIIKFLKTVQQAGLYAILRIGPYVCAEWNFGGFPLWLHTIPGIKLRTDNQLYKDEMQTFVMKIVDMLKAENLLAGQGGPIILTQIENEYGNIAGAYGAAGKSYIQWCAQMAVSMDVGVPWVMCQQADAPAPMINTCNGFYCDAFTPNSAKSPKMWTENWSGWFNNWGGKNSHRPAEDIAFAVARFFQRGGVLQNYYMYHGGTNFGRTAGGPYITTSYDYDAPLDEYGNIRQPKWGHLQKLHQLLFAMEDLLTSGTSATTTIQANIDATTYSLNWKSSCFLSNIGLKDVMVKFKGNQYSLPGWSVSILPNCQDEAYNTAKVGTQGHVMVKSYNVAGTDQSSLRWVWQPEPLNTPPNVESSLAANQLLEQIKTTGDASDYLWYTTSVNIETEDQMVLHVNTTGHGLHAFVNGKLVGTQYGTNGNLWFVMEKPVALAKGENVISLLSITVGLQNYGPFYDLLPAGIVRGPVSLIGKTTTLDLSSNKWLYTIGLHGEAQKLEVSSDGWTEANFPTNRFMTWYKTSFTAPSGTEAVVLDLQGMSKGHAYVNGQSIGRYWPSNIAPSDGCTPCDYKSGYSSSKCTTGCGSPTQRWYHIPRDYLSSGENSLVLFEELGGDPSKVAIGTVSIGSLCSNIVMTAGRDKNSSVMQLECPNGRAITGIEFASFGDPAGICGSYSRGNCHANSSFLMVNKACLGKSSCSMLVSEKTFGSAGTCQKAMKRLAVQAACG